MAKKPAIVARRSDGGYPYYTLTTCLKLGGAVCSAGGRDVPKAIIASELAMDESASNFAQLCSSAKTFGIVEGVRALSLTQSGHDYFLPTNDTDKRRALLAFFSSPPVFQHLILRFDGRALPQLTILANILHRERGVPASWSSRAASLFVGSADEVGVKDPNGFLRVEAARHQLDRNGSTQGSNTIPAEIPTIPQESSIGIAASGAGQYEFVSSSNVWVFSEAGGTVKLETPDPLPRALWQRLKKYVEMLEPGDSNTKGGQT